MATHNGISQSTAHTIKRDILAEFQAKAQREEQVQ
jgi:hypothetical protein